MRRLYQIHPWEVREYTPRELNDLARDMDEQTKAEREVG